MTWQQQNSWLGSALPRRVLADSSQLPAHLVYFAHLDACKAANPQATFPAQLLYLR
jgi:hypothetical protein